MTDDKKTILVCGGAGYIGSHVVRELLDSGYAVTIMDDLSTGHLSFVPEGVDFRQASIGDREALDAVFARQDYQAIVHLCANAYVGESVENPRKYYNNNIGSGLALLDAMIDHEVKQLVFSSSCAVYGYPPRIPLDEECPFAPISPYGRTKAMFEQILSDYSSAHGLRSMSLRYFNAAGALPGGEIGEEHDPETHLIPLVLRQALIQKFPDAFPGEQDKLVVFGDDYDTPDGTCVRDYIHVRDLASAHRQALAYLDDGGETTALNLANERGFSVLEVIGVGGEITGCAIPYEVADRRAGDPDRLIGSAELAHDVLGWRAQHSDIRSIIGSAWEWHQGEHERKVD